LYTSGQGKPRSQWFFGEEPEGNLFLERLVWVADELGTELVSRTAGKNLGSVTWLGCCTMLVAPVLRNKCCVPGQSPQIMPRPGDSSEELAGSLRFYL